MALKSLSLEGDLGISAGQDAGQPHQTGALSLSFYIQIVYKYTRAKKNLAYKILGSERSCCFMKVMLLVAGASLSFHCSAGIDV